jgi:hypothetical protein
LQQLYPLALQDSPWLTLDSLWFLSLTSTHFAHLATKHRTIFSTGFKLNIVITTTAAAQEVIFGQDLTFDKQGDVSSRSTFCTVSCCYLQS